MSKLGNTRCKRFAAYVVDGVVKHIEVSEAEDDPAGDDRPEASCIDNMLAKIAAL
jgi:peroxiredoxin